MEEKQGIRLIQPILGKIPRTGEKRPLSVEAQGLRDLMQLNRDAKQALKEYNEAIAETKAERGS